MTTYVTREQCMQALFNLLLPLKENGYFNTMSRRLKLFSAVPGGEQPALYLYEKDETHKRAETITPAIRQLEADIIIYINVGKDTATVPATLMNNLIDLIDPNSGGVLKPDNPQANRQTLGGLVWDCWIEGNVQKVPGDLDGQGMAVLKVKILIP